MSVEIGFALRVVREARLLERQALARRAGFDPSFVTLLERGRRRATPSTIARLAAALDVPPRLLLLLSSEPGAVTDADAAWLGFQVLALTPA